MAHINRRFIDKHWLVFILRGVLAGIFGGLMLFNGSSNTESILALMSVFLLFMGIMDSVGAIYCSEKKHGWFNAVIDALIDILAALALLFMSNNNLTNGVIIVSIYTVASGLIDIFHGFLSTVDPTDRFIRILAGVCGCILGIVILNAGDFELTIFIRFFGVYMIIVGVTSLIYGVHNRSQEVEDNIARKEARNKSPKKTLKKPVKKVAKKTK